MLSLGDTTPAGQSCKALGAVVHELGHAVGLWHEQSRPDRDSYVSIQWANMDPNAVVNFLAYSTSDMPSTTRYDYGSIMHYSSTVSVMPDALGAKPARWIVQNSHFPR